MAQYKVPQDVEAEDKLLGPFTFRQFIYLIIAAALGAVAFLLFRIFPFLVIIPIPFIIFMLVLALPLKKDQPMETYLAAVISFYTKPHKRVWEPGEPESTIVITAPKKIEEDRTNGLKEDEASRRLSFLAEIVDTEGYAIKGGANNQLSDEINAEASTVQDIFETPQNYQITQNLQNAADMRHNQLVEQMRNAIDNTRSLSSASASIGKFDTPIQNTHTSSAQSITVQPTAQYQQPAQPTAQYQQPVQPQPIQSQQPMSYPQPSMPTATLPAPGSFSGAAPVAPQPIVQSAPVVQTPNITPSAPDLPQAPSLPQNPMAGSYETEEDNPFVVKPFAEESVQEPAPQPQPAKEPTQDIIDLANNNDFSIETIAQQANRINKKNDDGEVYISLH